MNDYNQMYQDLRPCSSAHITFLKNKLESLREQKFNKMAEIINKPGLFYSKRNLLPTHQIKLLCEEAERMTVQIDLLNQLLEYHKERRE